MADATNIDTAMDLDDDLDMDVDAMPDDVTAALSTRAIKALEGPGPADAAAFESRADPAAASLVWRPRPDGTIDLPPAGAAMDDADDPGEDDVNMLQVDDEEIDDDVTAVGGDILGVGPTRGTVGGDPTSNLGRLGPELLQQVTGADGGEGRQQPTAGAAPTGHPPSPEQPAVTLPSTARPDTSQPPAVVPGEGGVPAAGAAGGGGPASTSSTPQTAATAGASDGGGGGGVSAGVLGVTGGRLSEGDADVRGITGQVVDEDADDLPLGFSRAGVAADAAATGLIEDEGGAAHTAAGDEGGDTAAGGGSRAGQLGGISAAGDAVGGGAAGGPAAGGVGAGGLSGGDEGAAGEYGPEEVDGLQAGAIRQEGGDFLPADYVRHRSRGQAGIDPDPRQGPDPDPAGGLRSLLDTQPEAAAAVAVIEGLQAGAASTAAVLRGVVGGADVNTISSSHPVHKDDFAMGGVAMPGLTDNAVLVTDYTEEPKHAAEVPPELEAPAERDVNAALAVQGHTGLAVSPGAGVGGVPQGSGQPERLAVGAGTGSAAAGEAEPLHVMGQDAAHLQAMFAPTHNTG